MRRAQPRPVSFALEAVAERLAPATLLAEVQRCWAGAAGDAFARRTEPVSERDGVVVVACGSAVWAQELDLLSEHVVERLNEALFQWAPPGVRDVKRPRDRGHNQVGTGQWREVDEHDSITEVGSDVVPDGQRQLRLADAARPGQRQERDRLL